MTSDILDQLAALAAIMLAFAFVISIIGGAFS